MKLKPLIIKFESIEEIATSMKKKVEEAIRTGVPSIQPKNVKTWTSIESYQRFMTSQKYAILACIAMNRPPSIYQLAKMLGRAQQNVARDCEALAGHGFIRFSGPKDGRKPKVARLSFDYNAIVVCLPAAAYTVEFGRAA
jgi:predicted transcriptional regulator